MRKENGRNILLRYGVIVGAILLLTLRIVYKLVDNTVLSADKWNQKAYETLSSIDTILPVRGDILAADGSILATNMRVYTPSIDFRVPKFREKMYRDSIGRISDSLALHFPERNAQQWREYLLKPLKKKADERTRYFPIVRKVSADEAAYIQTLPFFNRGRQFNGLHVESRLARVRPYGDMARRSIGATGETRSNKYPHGIYGLEKALDSLLCGEPGYSKKVALTSAIVDWTDKAPVNGSNVLTTIDIKMQDMLENELNKVLEVCRADWGTAVLMEVGTGDIKAISNLELSTTPGEGYIESLNRAVQRFEPGSVVKTLSMTIALDNGKITNPDKVYVTGRAFRYHGSSTSDCSKSESLPLRRALELSSNIVMSQMILEAYGDNPGQFYSAVKRSGFLDRFRTGIAEEVPPRIDSLGNKVWDKITLTRQSFGYGTEISPLYTCALYNAIAGGGQFVRPRLVRGFGREDGDTIFPVSYVRDRLCSETTASIVRDMLHRVVWGERGTARRVVKSDKVEIAGKTGTAKMVVGGRYADRMYRLSFCGFFPYQNPRYTCMVLIAYPKETWMSPETTSGRVVKNMAEAMYARGMLGNSTSLSDSTATTPTVPTYYATTRKGGIDNVHSAFVGGKHRSLRTPKLVAKNEVVPDVAGLGLREALRVLENAGYNVGFQGSGYVAGQTPAAGSKAKRGTKVKLYLKE